MTENAKLRSRSGVCLQSQRFWFLRYRLPVSREFFLIAPLGTCWPTTNLKHRSCNKLYVGTSLVHCKLQLWYQFELAFFVPVTTLAMKTLDSATQEPCFQASMADLSGSYYELLAPIVLNISKDWGVASHPLAARVQALAPKSSGEEAWGGTEALSDGGAHIKVPILFVTTNNGFWVCLNSWLSLYLWCLYVYPTCV